MTKHQKIDMLPNIDRRGFLVGAAATGLVFGYVALPEVKSALAAPAANFEPSVWYAIGMLVPAGIGAWLGPKLLRW